ncbi:hypothetical protein BFW01_g7475 [Lasiodiplodia theobromae]|nr:hypothetical protein BFW01_g7475 [Lasiodiplodia theobromae]
MLSAQGFDMLYNDPIPNPEESECPSRDTINEPSLLTPLSSNGTFPFLSDSNSCMGALSAESLPPTTEAESTVDPRRAMKHLADLGLGLHPKIARYQKASDDEVMRDLVGDALQSSTDYLNTLLVLVASFTKTQPGVDGQAPQLDMPVAFQVLIPYVRLVQLHSILFEAILRRLTGAAFGGAPRSVFPDIWVGGVCVNAGGLFRERLMLQISTHLLAEIETVLELPDEARICCPEPGGSGGGPKGTAANEAGAPGILRKAVSPRLLKMILDECDMGSTDVQSARERIACIKRLLRCSPL